MTTSSSCDVEMWHACEKESVTVFIDAQGYIHEGKLYARELSIKRRGDNIVETFELLASTQEPDLGNRDVLVQLRDLGLATKSNVIFTSDDVPFLVDISLQKNDIICVGSRMLQSLLTERGYKCMCVEDDPELWRLRKLYFQGELIPCHRHRQTMFPSTQRCSQFMVQAIESFHFES